MSTPRPRVIDADGHFCEPWHIWTEYTDPQLHELMPRSAGIDDDGFEIVRFGGIDRSTAPLGTGASITPGGTIPERLTTTWDEGFPGGFDPAQRVRDLDIEGIDQVVLYPSFGLGLNAIPAPDLVIAMCSALNRFLFEYCSEDPRRLFGVATLPMGAPDAAAVELRRCVEEYGFVAAMIHPKPSPAFTLRSPELEPVWNELERLDIAVGLHPTDGRALEFGVEHLFANFFEQCQLGFGIQTQTALVQVLCTDLLDRHPRLRFTLLESDIGWLPSLLDHMDARFRLQRSIMTAPVTEPPSELFARHCSIAGEAEERILGAALALLAEGTYMFSTDYPHHESEFPHTVEEVLERSDLPEPIRSAYLSENAARFYALA
jgi:hypothetical protein